MDSESVRQVAKMWALVAEMEEIKAHIEAMKVDNQVSKSQGLALAWPYEMFRGASEALSSISWKLRNEI